MIMLFSERLKLLRGKKGITQVEFANDFNIPKGTIAMCETGKREPDFDTLIKIASYFNVTTDYLLGGTELALYDTEDFIEKIIELGGIKTPRTKVIP